MELYLVLEYILKIYGIISSSRVEIKTYGVTYIPPYVLSA
jgi:hypothetical protein